MREYNLRNNAQSGHMLPRGRTVHERIKWREVQFAFEAFNDAALGFIVSFAEKAGKEHGSQQVVSHLREPSDRRICGFPGARTCPFAGWSCLCRV